MSYKDKTYVIFDGDNDKWAYAFMKGWINSENVDFDFEDAHDIYTMTNRASDEQYIKSNLKKRFQNAAQVILLIGESTKNLYKYVRWELDVALDLDLPIIAVNLNGLRKMDNNLCPPILKDKFPSGFKRREKGNDGPRIYNETIYQDLGLKDE